MTAAGVAREAWPTVPAGEVLRRVRTLAAIDPQDTYKQVTVRINHRGATLRKEVLGAELGTAVWEVRSGQFILSGIDARNGAFALVPPELDRAIVTNDFWAFAIDERLDPAFFDHFCGTASFRAACKRASEGSTNRVRLKPDSFARVPVPLPPLADQRRVVARLNLLLNRIGECQRLGAEVATDLSALRGALIQEAYDALTRTLGSAPISEVCTSITDGTHVTPTFSEEGVPFIFVGNVSSGKLTLTPSKRVAPAWYEAISESRRPERGDLVYSVVGATLGVPAIVDTDAPFCFQRHVAILKPHPKRSAPSFLWWMLQAPSVVRDAWARTTGSAQPTLPLAGLRRLKMPLAPMEVQLDVSSKLTERIGRLEAASTRPSDDDYATLKRMLLTAAFSCRL